MTETVDKRQTGYTVQVLCVEREGIELKGTVDVLSDPTCKNGKALKNF